MNTKFVVIILIVLVLIWYYASASATPAIPTPLIPTPLIPTPVIPTPGTTIDPTPIDVPIIPETPQVVIATAPGYQLYEGLDSAYGDLMYKPELAMNVQGLKNMCNNTPGCIAFNDGGWFKYQLLPRSQWNAWSLGPGTGTYVKQGVALS